MQDEQLEMEIEDEEDRSFRVDVTEQHDLSLHQDAAMEGIDWRGSYLELVARLQKLDQLPRNTKVHAKTQTGTQTEPRSARPARPAEPTRHAVKCAKGNGKQAMRKVASTGHVSHVCSMCDFERSTKYAVESHYRKIHMEEGPMVCGNCSYKTFNPDRYRRHTKNGCAKDRFKCSKCHFTCSAKNVLCNHVKIHNPPAYKCEYCGQEFVHSYNVGRHVKTMHKK